MKPRSRDHTPVDTADTPAATRAESGSTRAQRRALARLGGLFFSLLALAGVFLIGGVVGPEKIRAWIEPLGAWGPVLFIPLSAVLGTILVPGIALAAASGLLFGPVTGTAFR